MLTNQNKQKNIKYMQQNCTLFGFEKIAVSASWRWAGKNLQSKNNNNKMTYWHKGWKREQTIGTHMLKIMRNSIRYISWYGNHSPIPVTYNPRGLVRQKGHTNAFCLFCAKIKFKFVCSFQFFWQLPGHYCFTLKI